MQFLKDRVKIVATLGPNSNDFGIIKSMVNAGLDVARLNFSHGDHVWHKQHIKKIRESSSNVAIMADLQGPKIRLTDFIVDNIFLAEGSELKVAFGQKNSSLELIYINCDAQVFAKVDIGSIILFDDGKVSCEVLALESGILHCIVQKSGYLSSRKGVNVLGGGLHMSSFTDKDRLDLKFAIESGVDYVALSFVKNAQDILDVKQILGNKPIKVIAKIETQEAIENHESIILSADGIMVARGDLAVEVGAHRVPWLQKKLLARANYHKKPCIVATQMMESMINSSVPTRAEVSDVANAIIDGADAVMLSAETAVGADPVAVIACVADICLEANQHFIKFADDFDLNSEIPQVLACAAVDAASKLEADYLVALTETGSTALRFSKFGANAPILGLSRHNSALSHMSLYKNVTPIKFDVLNCGPDIYLDVVTFLKASGYVKSGQRLIITRGVSLGVVGETNSMVLLGV